MRKGSVKEIIRRRRHAIVSSALLGVLLVALEVFPEIGVYVVQFCSDVGSFEE